MEPTFHTALEADDVLVVTMDLPGKPVNFFSPALLGDLERVVQQIEQTAPVGVVIASAKPKSFNTGADLFAMRDMPRLQLADYLATGQSLIDRIAKLPMPTVAAINGHCLGGGYELALACRYRIAADDDAISIGLPEVTLGLIPAWGGTTRLPRLLGLDRALPILLGGQTMPPHEAVHAGLVDEVVSRDGLLQTAKRWVTKPPQLSRPLTDRATDEISPATRHALDTARAQLAGATADDPAPLRLLDVIDIGLRQGVAAGLAAEHQAILELFETEATQNRLRQFFQRQREKKRGSA